MSASAANVMISIFMNCSQRQSASVVSYANTVVTDVQNPNRISSTVIALIGNFFGSRERSQPVSVAIATASANEKPQAKPQVKRCGFM